jgi:N-acetylglucosaminyl-diphospho-decaprenol L-rhamnosyltransferase
VTAGPDLPTVSIAVVLHNSAEHLEACLASIAPAVRAGWAELIAVDNASPDRSAAIVHERLPEATVITTDRNLGFAAGANRALRQATGELWLLCNPDVIVPDGGLRTLVDWMLGHPQLGATSPELQAPGGRWSSPGRAFPSILRTLAETARLHRLLSPRDRGRIFRGPYWPGGDQLRAGWVPGTAMLIRPAAIRDVGPLREDLFLYGEDIELCWRLRRRGWQIGVCAQTSFIHHESSSARVSFGDDATLGRIVAGIDGACRIMYGSAHARVLAAATALSLAAEAAAPGRTGPHRSTARAHARLWWARALTA